MKTAKEEEGLEPSVKELQERFLCLGREYSADETQEYLADLESAGVTDTRLIEAGLCICGSTLCRADGTEFIASLGGDGSWPTSIRRDRAILLG